MDRRDLLALTLAAAPVALAAGKAEADAEPNPAKVAYHLVDLDKVDFVLGNIRNHFDGMGGPDKVTIVLVVHGPALKAFRVAGVSPSVNEHAAALSKSGLTLTACGNTMRGQNIALQDLLPGFTVAEEGGVVRLAKLQGQGFVYLRP